MRFLAPLFHFDGMRVVQVCGLHVEETWATQENYRNVSLCVNTVVEKPDA